MTVEYTHQPEYTGLGDLSILNKGDTIMWIYLFVGGLRHYLIELRHNRLRIYSFSVHDSIKLRLKD